MKPPAPESPRREDRVDRLQVGAMFGAVAGVVALLVVLAYGLVARLWSQPPPLGRLALVHGVYVLLYASTGAAMGLLWPRRRHWAGRFGLHLLAAAAIVTSSVSVADGPLWAWTIRTWGLAGLATLAYGVVLGWPPRRREPRPLDKV